MKQKHQGKRLGLVVVCLALCLLALTGCNNADNNVTPNDDVTTSQYGTNSTRVAGLDRQMIYGYIMDINEQARTITIDQVEMLSASNADRLRALNLTTADLTNGYYVHNASVERRMYPLDTAVDFDLDTAYSTEYSEYYNGANDRGVTTTPRTTDLNDNSVTNNGLGDNGVINNGVTNNGLTNNGLGNDGVTNNGVTNNNRTNVNGVTNNGVTNNGVTNNGVTNNGVTNMYDWGMAADQGYDRYDYYGRITNRLGHSSDLLYCFTVENGKVVAVRDCSNMLR